MVYLRVGVKGIPGEPECDDAGQYDTLTLGQRGMILPVILHHDGMTGQRITHITTGFRQFYERIGLVPSVNFDTQYRFLGVIAVIPGTYRMTR